MSEPQLFARPYELGSARSSQVWVCDVGSGTLELIHENFDMYLEAPNWGSAGDSLLVSGAGALWSLSLESGALLQLPTKDLPPVTNDHILDAEDNILVTAFDGQIYEVPGSGGAAVPLTSDASTSHFLHSASPDGDLLAYISMPFGDWLAAGRLAVLDRRTGAVSVIDVGATHCDGPEFAPDGRIVCSTEQFTSQRHHAQIASVSLDGGDLERLTNSDTVDLFPHISPSGVLATYISFPPGTVGRPADVTVTLSVVNTSKWNEPNLQVDVFGGQGTFNVNSWSPGSDRFAFVAYPERAEQAPSVHSE